MEIKISNTRSKKSAVVDLNTSEEFIELFGFYRLRQVIKKNVEYAFLLTEENPINAWDVVQLGYVYFSPLEELVDYQLPLDFQIEKINKINFK